MPQVVLAVSVASYLLVHCFGNNHKASPGAMNVAHGQTCHVQVAHAMSLLVVYW